MFRIFRKEQKAEKAAYDYCKNSKANESYKNEVYNAFIAGAQWGKEEIVKKLNSEEYKKLEDFESKERLSIWSIVRYKKDGEYDCVWSSGHTKREADKRCKALNEDYHKKYGKYVVEING